MAWIKTAWDYFQRTVSPKHFYDISGRWLPWFWAVAIILIGVGTVWGLAFAPPDYQQGNSYRIMFIHVLYQPLYRRGLGQAHLGHLLGVGCEADLHADPVVLVHGRAGPVFGL